MSTRGGPRRRLAGGGQTAGQPARSDMRLPGCSRARSLPIHICRQRQTRREAGAQSQGSRERSPSCRPTTTKWLDKEVLVPYIISRPPRRALALAAACLGLLVAAAPAAAKDKPENPADQVSKPVFAALGDTADYFALTGGTFEGDTTDWTLTGAQVVPGNAPLQVGSLGGSDSLSIAPGGV